MDQKTFGIIGLEVMGGNEDLLTLMSASFGIAARALMSAESSYDGYRSDRLPANLLSLQRDYFGAHGYRCLDRDGIFHTRWDSAT